ncbi:MAG: creatininase family protein, partial [Bacteroidales bacterium]|nr:creatininase family protein [Bacteroidales bacterium]
MNKSIVYFSCLMLLVIAFSGCSQSAAEIVKEEITVEYIKLTPTDFRIKIAEAPIAYLPLGTLEWHGEHLPLGSDGMQSFSFMKDLARDAGG